MTVKDLVDLIEKASYLSATDKEKWQKLLPKMDPAQLKELARIMLWAEKQKKNLSKEKEIVIAGVAEVFTALNLYATKRAAKEVPRILENEIKKEEEMKLNNLMKDLGNE
jgi:Tfp pilus assembly pilus retraction ATPase PilT